MNCIHCDLEMKKARLTTGMAIVYAEVSKEKWLDGVKRCSVSCYVCPKCGYIELRADNPETLI